MNKHAGYHLNAITIKSGFISHTQPNQPNPPRKWRGAVKIAPPQEAIGGPEGGALARVPPAPSIRGMRHEGLVIFPRLVFLAGVQDTTLHCRARVSLGKRVDDLPGKGSVMLAFLSPPKPPLSRLIFPVWFTRRDQHLHFSHEKQKPKKLDRPKDMHSFRDSQQRHSRYHNQEGFHISKLAAPLVMAVGAIQLSY